MPRDPFAALRSRSERADQEADRILAAAEKYEKEARQQKTQKAKAMREALDRHHHNQEVARRFELESHKGAGGRTESVIHRDEETGKDRIIERIKRNPDGSPAFEARKLTAKTRGALRSGMERFTWAA